MIYIYYIIILLSVQTQSIARIKKIMLLKKILQLITALTLIGNVDVYLYI